MTTYLTKRLLLMIPTFFGVSLVVWVVLSLAPEPPIEAQSPSEESAKQADRAGGMSEAVKVFRAQYGLDKPKLLNTYYEIDRASVVATLKAAYDIDREYEVKDKNRAREQLIHWGYYVVPDLIAIQAESDGALRDAAMSWTVQLGSRVTNIPPGGRVDAATAAKNEETVRENKMLRRFSWAKDDSGERKAAGVACFRLWLDGARDGFGPGATPDDVRGALDAGDTARFESWGTDAVPGLVEIALTDGARAQAAADQLTRSGRRTGTDETTKLQNATVQRFGWPDDAPEWQSVGGREFIRVWWQGAGDRWDYGGWKKYRVLFLETQFARYWRNLVSFDLGNSTVHKRPVFELIFSRLKYSLSLAVPSLLIAFIIAVPLGLVSATMHGTWIEKAMAVFVFALYSLPSFFVATILIAYLAQGQPGSIEIIPAGDFESQNAPQLTTTGRLMNIGWHLIAPLFCMTYGSLAALSRYSKSGLMNVIRSDYVRTARSKGVGEFWVIVKHAGRNGIIPVITLLGTSLPILIGGSFVIETIFTIPGFGLLTVQAIFTNDYNVVIGVTLITAVLVMVGILLSDLLYAATDPRISLS